MKLTKAQAQYFLDRLEKQADIQFDAVRPRWQRPLSATVGRLYDPLTALILQDSKALRSADPNHPDMARTIEELKERYPELNTAVRFRGSRPIDDVIRTWKNKRLSLMSKLYGTATAPIRSLLVELTRADHYNPFADSITTYRNIPEILDHEVGHAKDWHDRPRPGLNALAYGAVPFASLFYEHKANREAAKRHIEKVLDNPDGISDEALKRLHRYNRLSGASFGSYMGGAVSTAGGILPGTPIPPLIGAVIGRQGVAGNPTMWMTDEEREKFNKLKKKPKDNDTEKQASITALTPVGAVAGGLIGGTAGYLGGDKSKNTKERLRRALKGAAIGTSAGAGLGVLLGERVNISLGDTALRIARENYNNGSNRSTLLNPPLYLEDLKPQLAGGDPFENQMPWKLRLSLSDPDTPTALTALARAYRSLYRKNGTARSLVREIGEYAPEYKIMESTVGGIGGGLAAGGLGYLLTKRDGKRNRKLRNALVLGTLGTAVGVRMGENGASHLMNMADILRRSS